MPARSREGPRQGEARRGAGPGARSAERETAVLRLQQSAGNQAVVRALGGRTAVQRACVLEEHPTPKEERPPVAGVVGAEPEPSPSPPPARPQKAPPAAPAVLESAATSSPAQAGSSPQSGQPEVTGQPVVTVPDRPLIRLGSRGEHVGVAQTILNLFGAGLDVDGAFGNLTAGAVRSFQQANGLAADAIVGPKTWAALQGQGPAPSAQGQPSTSGGTVIPPPATPGIAQLRMLLLMGGAAVQNTMALCRTLPFIEREVALLDPIVTGLIAVGLTGTDQFQVITLLQFGPEEEWRFVDRMRLLIRRGSSLAEVLFIFGLATQEQRNEAAADTAFVAEFQGYFVREGFLSRIPIQIFDNGVSATAVATASSRVREVLSSLSTATLTRFLGLTVDVHLIPHGKTLDQLPLVGPLVNPNPDFAGQSLAKSRGVFLGRFGTALVLAIGEEEIVPLGDPNAHPPGFTVAHEMGHVIHNTFDPLQQQQIRTMWTTRLKQFPPPPVPAPGTPSATHPEWLAPSFYTAGNEFEYFAQSTAAWMGKPAVFQPPDSLMFTRLWLQSHDPQMFNLLSNVFAQ